MEIMDPNTALEAAAEGAKALTKFQEIVQQIFNPRWTKKQTDADMEANERKLQMIRDNPDMEIVFAGDEMYARKTSPDILAYRAEQRMFADAIRQESNIEKVLESASRELPAAEAVSDEAVDDDWVARFFSIVKDISNEEMQHVWGKILAGEIVAPKSFSLKTLDVLRNISATEAKMFQNVAQLVVHHGDNYFLPSEDEILRKFGSSFSDVLALDECGLINSSGTVSLNLHVSTEKTECIMGDNLLIAITGCKDNSEKVSVGIYALTKAGRELYSILSHSLNEVYVNEVAQYVFKKNKSKAKVSVHQLLSFERKPDGDYFTYTKTPSVCYEENGAVV